MSVTTLYVILIAAAAAAAAVYYVRLGAKRPGHAAALSLLKAGAIAALLLAFFQPAVRFTRLSTEPPRIAVLLDASQSMQLFGADTLVASLLSRLENRPAEAQPACRLSYFCFGDSLRPCPAPPSTAFADRKSTFPVFSSHDRLRDAHSVLIVSDGNWSNATPPRADMDKSYFYLQMPSALNRPYVRIETEAVPAEVPLDSISRVCVRVLGYAATDGPLSLACTRGGREVAHRSLDLAAGFFADTVLMRLPSSQAGTFLYEVRVRSESDSMYATSHLIQQVVPKTFTATLYAPRPSLDKRFLTLALRGRGNWEIAPGEPSRAKADLAFFFTWDAAAREMHRNLPAHTTAVFVGCAPCDELRSFRPLSFLPRLGPEYLSDTAATLIASLPPPGAVVTCPRLKTALAPILSALMQHDGVVDSLPLLFEVLHGRRRSLVLAIEGFWRWQFWPLSFGRGTSESSFAGFFLDRIQELMRANMNRSFYAFVEKTPSFETDSLHFRIVLPAHFHDQALDTVRLVLVSPRADTVLDTAVHDIFAGRGMVRFTTPPLPAGPYAFRVEAQSAAGTLACGDSLHVHRSNAELQVRGQNTVLLGQFAASLDPADTSDIVARILGHTRTESTTRTQLLRITQTWYLLALALLLLGLEWFLRKKWRLD